MFQKKEKFIIELDFKKQKPVRNLKPGDTPEEKARYDELEQQASFLAKNLLLPSVRKFAKDFPDERDAYFIVRIIDNNVFFVYTPTSSPDFRNLIRYDPLKISNPTKLWDRVGKHSRLLGIREYTVLNRENTYLYYVDFLSKAYLLTKSNENSNA